LPIAAVDAAVCVCLQLLRPGCTPDMFRRSSVSGAGCQVRGRRATGSDGAIFGMFCHPSSGFIRQHASGQPGVSTATESTQSSGPGVTWVRVPPAEPPTGTPRSENRTASLLRSRAVVVRRTRNEAEVMVASPLPSFGGQHARRVRQPLDRPAGPHRPGPQADRARRHTAPGVCRAWPDRHHPSPLVDSAAQQPASRSRRGLRK
jgi:hypothetical protein